MDSEVDCIAGFRHHCLAATKQHANLAYNMNKDGYLWDYPITLQAIPPQNKGTIYYIAKCRSFM